MRLLIDAQLPRRLAHMLRDAGHYVVHTLDLPKGNRTVDSDLLEVAQREDLILVSKDTDFLNSHLLYGRPAKLLLVTTGKIDNRTLLALISANLERIIVAFETSDWLEVSLTSLVSH